jgi:hypothetical protein
MAAKKKTPSAADFRKAEETSKAKSKPATPTATYKGNKVDWKTPKPAAGNTVKPGKAELRSGGTLGRLHNEARSIAVGGAVFKAASQAVVKKVSSVVGQASFQAASKGLGSATGAGGKVRTVTTPMGKTLASTNIGTAAQQSARIENLLKNADRISETTTKNVLGQTMRGINMSGKVVQNAATSALTVSSVKDKKKKK